LALFAVEASISPPESDQDDCNATLGDMSLMNMEEALVRFIATGGNYWKIESEGK
jgi:hypothetical protein